MPTVVNNSTTHAAHHVASCHGGTGALPVSELIGCLCPRSALRFAPAHARAAARGHAPRAGAPTCRRRVTLDRQRPVGACIWDSASKRAHPDRGTQTCQPPGGVVKQRRTPVELLVVGVRPVSASLEGAFLCRSALGLQTCVYPPRVGVPMCRGGPACAMRAQTYYADRVWRRRSLRSERVSS